MFRQQLPTWFYEYPKILTLIALLISGTATAGYPWDGDWTWRLQTGAASHHNDFLHTRYRACDQHRVNHSPNSSYTGPAATCEKWYGTYERPMEAGDRIRWNERNIGLGVEGSRYLEGTPNMYFAVSAGAVEDSFGELSGYAAAGYQWQFAQFGRFQARATLMTALHYRTVVDGFKYDSCGTIGGDWQPTPDGTGHGLNRIYRCETPKLKRELLIYPFPALTVMDSEGFGVHLSYAPKAVTGVETWILKMTYAL